MRNSCFRTEWGKNSGKNLYFSLFPRFLLLLLLLPLPTGNTVNRKEKGKRRNWPPLPANKSFFFGVAAARILGLAFLFKCYFCAGNPRLCHICYRVWLRHWNGHQKQRAWDQITQKSMAENPDSFFPFYLRNQRKHSSKTAKFPFFKSLRPRSKVLQTVSTEVERIWIWLLQIAWD